MYSSASNLANAILRLWPARTPPFVVFTGGEPTLQLDNRVVDALHDAGAEIAIETNGTRPVVVGVDWICVSPKAGAHLRQVTGDEIKVAWPQRSLDLDSLEALDFRYRFLQPIDGPDAAANTRLTLAACRELPAWELSLQVHKIIGIP